MASAKKKNWTVTKQVELANFFGVSIDTVKSWAKQEMPGRAGAYDLGTIVRWLRTEGPWRQHARADTNDPLLDGDDETSDGLERYRQAKAALAELELAEREQALLSIEKARTTFGRWAAILRRLGERLGKRYGPEAAVALNDAIAECSSTIDRELGQPDDGGEPADDSAR